MQISHILCKCVCAHAHYRERERDEISQQFPIVGLNQIKIESNFIGHIRGISRCYSGCSEMHVSVHAGLCCLSVNGVSVLA